VVKEVQVTSGPSPGAYGQAGGPPSTLPFWQEQCLSKS
jgi:hypothetical protein